MAEPREIESKVLDLLTQFISSTGRHVPAISSATHLTKELGFESIEGVDFTLDLCDAFGVELPMNFNPFVDDSGTKGRTFGEMISAISKFVTVEKVA